MEEQRHIAWHHQSSEDVFKNLTSSPKGLSEKAAQKRLKEYGLNQLPQKPPRSKARIFFSQLGSPLMIILLIAAGLSLVLREWLDVSVIMLIVVLNVLLGFFEEYKADRSLEKLKNFLPQVAMVRREGKTRKLEAKQIVPGDVMLLSSGDKITADARVFDVDAFEVSEAALTGESVPIEKRIKPLPLKIQASDQKNMVFAGSVVVSGKAEAIVVETGTNTEIGRISDLVAEEGDHATPLQEQLQKFAVILGVVFTLLTLLIFVIGIVRGESLVYMFRVAVAVAVSSIPEGLAVGVTVIFAVGMRRILKRKALIRRLVATETLGSVSVICIDKTGTVTAGKMVVDEVRLGTSTVDKQGTSKELKRFKQYIRLANFALEEKRDDGKVIITGSPTEIVLREYVRTTTTPGYEVTAELPFDSNWKFAATAVTHKEEHLVIAIGAPDVLLERASGKEEDALNDAISEMTEKGLRVIAVAIKDGKRFDKLKETDVKGMQIAGLIGLRDPVRKGVKAAIKKAKIAGLRPVMITGDHPQTALAIAREVGITDNKEEILTGYELDNLSDHELTRHVSKVSVYARVLPAHKLRIVKAWQTLGASVAMTGDGVNDAPAIKAADIGIALGSGTAVAQETADMVLLNDSFSTIVEAIREGRTIFDNVRKVIVYLLSHSFSEMLLITGALLLSLPLPLLPVHILWINLMCDVFPTMALTFEPGEKEIMKEPPRKKTEPILNKEMKILIFIIGISTDILLFALFFYLLGQDYEIERIRTFIYAKLGIDALVYIFAIRKFRSPIWATNPFSNKYLLVAVFLGLFLQFIPLMVTPLREAFGFTLLSFSDWILIFFLVLLTIILIEAVKFLSNRKKRA